MSGLLKRLAMSVAVGGVATLALGAACYAIGARVNTTRSIPLGLYWTSDAPVETGRYVMFCPPQLGVFEEARRRGYIAAGFCPGGYGYIMKKVLAANGDAINVAADGVRVNGRLLSDSAPFKADKSGRAMARFQSDAYVLSEFQVLLMSDVNPGSFDSRYFGPIQRSQIKTVISPVFIW